MEMQAYLDSLSALLGNELTSLRELSEQRNMANLQAQTVYLRGMAQMLEWMRNPQALEMAQCIGSAIFAAWERYAQIEKQIREHGAKL